MRIISGQWRGRPLLAPPGQATRPTSDRARETLFSMLASRLGGFDALRVADLFAGSGALGLEAMSRGAAHCTFVERDRAAVRAIESNAAKLGAAIEIIAGDALRLPAARGPFDLILADPPYAEGAGRALIEAVAEADWLASGGWLVVETKKGEVLDPAPFTLDAHRDVGAARLHLMMRA